MAKELPNRLSVSICQPDIDMAIKGDEDNCPIALALARVYPGATRIKVREHNIKLSDSVARERYTWETPDFVREWLQEYDLTNREVGPLKIVLRKQDSKITPMRTRSPEERVAAKQQAAERKQRQANESKEQRAERDSRNELNRQLRRRGLK